MQTWILKFLGGLIPWVSKPFGEWFGKILFYTIISTLVLLAFNRLFPTKPTTTIEKIETQVVNQCPEEHKAFGIKMNIWKLKLGVGI